MKKEFLNRLVCLSNRWGLLSGFFLLSASAFAVPVDVSYAPANDLALTVSAIQSAQQTLLVNIYDLSSTDIANALIQKIQSGVQVAILIEGQPVGGIPAQGKAIASQIASAMQAAGGSNKIFEMTKTAAGPRRFRFDHAKYIVVDASSLLIGSENYSPTGNPEPGTLGNRGWEAFIHDPTLAQQFQSMFAQDCDPTKPDIVDLTGGTPAGSMTADLAVNFALAPALEPKGHHTPTGNGGVIPSPYQPPQPVQPIQTNPATLSSGTLEADSVAGFASPTTSQSSVLYLIQHANVSIDIQQMTFEENWGAYQSPILAALVQAAQRGVKVRVLLNDDSVFNQSGSTGSSSQTNELTANFINQSNSPNFSALIANVKAMGVDYIHNKGGIFDGNITMISSVNWDQNSFENNRETGAVIQGASIASYYETLFENDWQVSTSNPRSSGGGLNSGDGSNNGGNTGPWWLPSGNNPWLSPGGWWSPSTWLGDLG